MKKENKFNLHLQELSFRFIKLLFLLMMGVTLFLNFFLGGIEYACTRHYSNVRIFMPILAVFVVCCLVYFCCKYLEGSMRKWKFKMPREVKGGVKAATVLLFFWQLYVVYNIFFMTGWDVGGKIIPGSLLLAEGNIETFTAQFSEYFSRNPNNIPLIVLYSLLSRINDAVGIWGADNQLMCILSVNCLINSLTCYLTYKTAGNLMGKGAALIGYIFVAILVGLSPWISIPYTDSLALFFPVFILFLYSIKVGKRYRAYVKYGLITFTGYIGYLFKPQVIIIVIAIALIELLRLLSEKGWGRLKEYLVVLLACVVALGLGWVISEQVFTIRGFEPDTERALDAVHYFKMGQNAETGGTWSIDDINVSMYYADRNERRWENLRAGLRRIRDFGPIGYVEFLARKNLTNYNDGTFAWACEGNFYKEVYEPKNEVASPLLRNIYYTGGTYYHYYAETVQGIWLLVLLLCPCSLLLMGKSMLRENSFPQLVLILALEGLTIFELLFEARARYLYTYVPLFIILAMMGLERFVHLGIWGKLSERIVKRKFV